MTISRTLKIQMNKQQRQSNVDSQEKVRQHSRLRKSTENEEKNGTKK